MLTDLKFVQGAVARKDFVPVLTHFHISEGRIYGYNGSIGLSSPLNLDFSETISPKAGPFYKAIEACKEETAVLYMTPAKRLAIKSGSFKAYIDCSEDTFPEIKPQGDYIELNDNFIDAIKKVSPFIGEDASRPWSRGVLFDGQSVFVTNNIVLVQYWLETPFPVKINVPGATINELLRIKENPIGLSVSSQSVTFHFEGDRWLVSALGSLEWPDLDPIFDKAEDPNPEDFPDNFFSALEDLKPFTDEAGRIFILGDTLSTSSSPEDIGASIVLDTNITEKGIYNVNQLIALEDFANVIDFTQYPGPSPFFGDKVRGMIIGMHG